MTLVKAGDENVLCITCGQRVIPAHDKPGKLNECHKCGERSDVPRVGGNMIWSHKTAPELEIKSMVEAKHFAKLQQRFGAGPLKSIVEKKEEPGKVDGANPGDVICSPLNEKHSIKR